MLHRSAIAIVLPNKNLATLPRKYNANILPFSISKMAGKKQGQKPTNGGSLDSSEMFLLETPFDEWTTDQLAHYFKTKADVLGGDYAEMIAKHRITGKVCHRLKDEDLKEMGVSNVGDRLTIMEEIDKITRVQQQKDREKAIWEGREELYFNWWDKCVSTCCGCCPDDPDMYKLTGTHLTIKHIDPVRCGPIRCCCGMKYHIDNIDLSNVTDADVKGVPPSCCQQCCCGKTQEHIYVKANGGTETKVMKLTKEEGATVARKILNQVEVMQRMERN